MAALNHANVNLVSDGGGGDVYLFGTNAASSTNCIRYNCSEGCRANATNDNYIETNCTVVDATGFGVLRPRAIDSVSLETNSAAYLQVGVSSSNYWADDGTGDNAITEGTPTDIFEDYAGGDYRIKASSSPGAAGAGAFINSGGSGVTGTITQTTESFTQSSSGAVANQFTGIIVQTASGFTQSAIGSFTSADFTGVISQTTSSFTQSATGSFTEVISGVINQTASSFTQALVGSVVSDTTGIINTTFSAFTQSANGVVPIPVITSDGLVGSGSLGSGVSGLGFLGGGINGSGNI